MKVPTAIIIKLMPKMNKFATNSYIYIRKHNHNITRITRKIFVIWYLHLIIISVILVML